MSQNMKRRKFIIQGLQGIGIAAVSGLIWSAHIDKAKAAPLTLRPPGALTEKDFLKSCIRCGMCVEACPFDTLSLASPGDGAPLGTPFFIPRDIPCYMCDDIPCVPPCPTGALDIKSVSTLKDNGVLELDIDKSKMGLAVVDKDSCIAFWGIQCDACYRACPLSDKAITLEHRRNDRTGKHSFLLPIVHSDPCTGCGLCERACVTEKAAIFVLPREVAMGKAGSHYIKGWDTKDEKRLEGVSTEVETKTDRSSKKATDYLNMGDLLDE